MGAGGGTGCASGESQVRPVAPGETRLHARAYMGARHGFVTPSVRPRLPSWAVRGRSRGSFTARRKCRRVGCSGDLRVPRAHQGAAAERRLRYRQVGVQLDDLDARLGTSTRLLRKTR